MPKLHDLFHEKKSSGVQRNLRVGEEIRHALADIFLRGECHSPNLMSASITVSEVRVAPDLKNATAFVMPLAGRNKEELLESLKMASPELRHLVSKRVKLRYTPKLFFQLDSTYDEAQKINNLLLKPEVIRDISKSDE
ncbi:MAG: 30S ribosome-binding factor RbfA [Alphaproteobacteria bacterium]|nr:30S ribosome-binding factor RbfA [Alphaproteobacteria bacterium]